MSSEEDDGVTRYATRTLQLDGKQVVLYCPTCMRPFRLCPLSDNECNYCSDCARLVCPTCSYCVPAAELEEFREKLSANEAKLFKVNAFPTQEATLWVTLLLGFFALPPGDPYFKIATDLEFGKFVSDEMETLRELAGLSRDICAEEIEKLVGEFPTGIATPGTRCFDIATYLNDADHVRRLAAFIEALVQNRHNTVVQKFLSIFDFLPVFLVRLHNGLILEGQGYG